LFFPTVFTVKALYPTAVLFSPLPLPAEASTSLRDSNPIPMFLLSEASSFAPAPIPKKIDEPSSEPSTSDLPSTKSLILCTKGI